jgi:hypothetical protein
MTDKKPEHPAPPAARPVEAASAAPGERRAAVRPLARGSESGDPAVQSLLAGRQTAWMNGDEDAAAKATAALAELGFE